MRVVVDTNVFISAALRDSSLPMMALRLIEERHTFLKSVACEKELRLVLARKKFSRLISPTYHLWLDGFFERAEAVTVVERIKACRDPADDKFLELAVNGGAEILLSGDDDLLSIKQFRSVLIVSPSTYVLAHG